MSSKSGRTAMSTLLRALLAVAVALTGIASAVVAPVGLTPAAALEPAPTCTATEAAQPAPNCLPPAPDGTTPNGKPAGSPPVPSPDSPGKLDRHFSAPGLSSGPTCTGDGPSFPPPVPCTYRRVTLGARLYVPGAAASASIGSLGMSLQSDPFPSCWHLDTCGGTLTYDPLAFDGTRIVIITVSTRVVTGDDFAGYEQRYGFGLRVTGTRPKPSAAFTADVRQGAVDFHATSTDSAGLTLFHTWTFGDGTTGTGSNPTHTYDKPGTYQVTLKSTDTAQASDTVTKDVVIKAPTLALGIDLLDGAGPPLLPDRPVRVRVTVSASADGVGPVDHIRFTDTVLRIAPAAAFDVTSGPTPSAPAAGFALQPGTQRTVDLTLTPRQVGRYTLSSAVTGTDATGTTRTAEASSPGVIGDALTLTITLDPPSAKLVEGPNGPVPIDVTATITLKNTTDVVMDAVTLTSLRVDRTAPGQLLAVTQTGGVAPGDAGHAIGALAPGQQRSVTATFRTTDDAEVEFSAQATAHLADGRTELGIGTKRWSVKPTYLLGLTTRVTNPAGSALLPAGELARIEGTVHNLSTTASLVVGPLYPQLKGNAGVMSLAWDTVGTDPAALVPVQSIKLGPGDTRHFTVRILTSYSDPTRIVTDGNRSGGTYATATFTPWGEATHVDGTKEAITPDKVRATEADLTHRFAIDDSVTIPATDPLALAGAISIGAVEGVINATAATLMSVVDVVKLPYTILAATAEFQSQVWDSFTPAERDAFAQDTGLMAAAVLARNADFARLGVPALIAKAKRASLTAMTQLANDWVLGDYTRTARLYSRYAADAVGQVLVPIALAKLARSPRAVAALARAQKELQAAMRPVLVSSATLQRIEQLGPVLAKLASGTELTAAETETLYGISAAELAELQRIGTENNFLLTVRSRHASSITWIERFQAMLKPETLKIKTVSELDVKLGYRAGDVGSLVFRKPEALTRFERGAGDLGALMSDFAQSRGFVEGTPEWASAIQRQFERVTEWRKWEKYYKRWNTQGWIDVSLNYSGNHITDPIRKGRSALGVAPLESGKFVGFRLNPIGQDEYVLQMMNNKVGRFVPITGDIDPIAFTHLDGSPLTMAEHAYLLDLLAKNPLLQTQHGESATFVNGGVDFVLGQFKPGEPALQIAPGGAAPRVVRLNPGKSRWTSAEDYHLHWDGGYVYSGTFLPKGARPLPAYVSPAAVEPLTMRPRAVPQAVTSEPNVGRCHVTFAAAATAVAAIMNAQGRLVRLGGDGKSTEASDLQSTCFSAGPAVDVVVKPVTGLSAPARVGATELAIPSGDPWLASAGDGLRVGDTVTVGAGTPNAETHQIIAFGSIIIAEGLRHPHDAGELIAVRRSAVSGASRPAPHRRKPPATAAAAPRAVPGSSPLGATGVAGTNLLVLAVVLIGIGAAAARRGRRSRAEHAVVEDHSRVRGGAPPRVH